MKEEEKMSWNFIKGKDEVKEIAFIPTPVLNKLLKKYGLYDKKDLEKELGCDIYETMPALDEDYEAVYRRHYGSYTGAGVTYGGYFQT